MLKRLLSSAAALGILTFAAPVLAANTPSSTQIACVGNAVNAREQALSSGISTYAQALTAAYSTRASALQAAYSQTPGNGAIRNAIKSAWSAFNTSMKNARKAWQSSRNSAWSQYRTAVKACRAPAVATDSANSSSENSGQ